MKNFKDYSLNEWLYWLEHRTTDKIKLDLERVTLVAETMGLLHPNALVITVAGTNGKGSTTHLLSNVYNRAGVSTGLYTSPHLIHFNERIVINGCCVSDKDICQAFCMIEESRGNIELTYFEVTTLAALYCFKEAAVELIILEVGMGGRLDAVNIIDPHLSIITTIALDHQEWLGDTIEKIAYEKAGIMRSKVPCIYADNPIPKAISDKAKALLSPLYQALPEHDENIKDTLVHPHAVASVIKAVELLSVQIPVAKEIVIDCAKTLQIPGRQQLVQKGLKRIMFDVAHNEQGALALFERLKTLNIRGRLHVIVSALKDKDIYALLKPLKHVKHKIYPVVLDYPRAMDALHINHTIGELGLDALACQDDFYQVFDKALHYACSDDLILVYGSFYLVGPLLQYWQNKLDNNQPIDTGELHETGH